MFNKFLKIIVPKHIAIIMDGNGRWALNRNKPRFYGHKEGLKSLKDIIYFSIKIKLNILTLYVFSNENWYRPQGEVYYLMRLIYFSLKNQIFFLHKNKVCVKIVGDKKRLPSYLLQYVKKIEILTKSNLGLRLNIAISYSGQWDIMNCIKKIVSKIKKKYFLLNQINHEIISQNMCLNDLPPIDLVIRTGGRKRISNFFLWQLAYAELFFTDILWPDFKIKDFKISLKYFSKVKRNFGKINN